MTTLAPETGIEPLLGRLPSLFADRTAIARVRTLAASTPEIPRGGFECRLAVGAERRVDLQWCVRRVASEQAILLRWLESRIGGGTDRDGSWRRLADFVETWSRPDGPLLGAIGEIWLEFDVETGDPAAKAPAIFIHLPHDIPNALESWEVVRTSLSILLPHEDAAARTTVLRKCFEACPEGSFAGYIGAMLSRAGAPLRANIKRLPAAELPAYLGAIGWNGAKATVESAVALVPHADRLTFCLDMTDRVHDSIGVECGIDDQPPESLKWAGLIRHFVEQELIAPDAAEALTGWGAEAPEEEEQPGGVVPTSPAARMELGMSPRSDRLGRRVSHVKLSVSASGVREAKAYLWFEHAAARRAGGAEAPPDRRIDVGDYYSREQAAEWRPILGDDLHYHFGFSQGRETLEEGVREAVRQFYPHIPRQARVLDVGCGWGGPAQMLRDELGCAVTGMTASAAQAATCVERGIPAYCADWDAGAVLPAGFDVAFCLEMIEHVRDKSGLLKAMRGVAPRLVLSSNCLRDDLSPHEAFGGSMLMCTTSDLVEAVERAGWTIRAIRNRRVQSMRTLVLWGAKLDAVYGESQAPGPIEDLRRLVATALTDPITWCRDNPLIDIVAD